ncbi:MAG: type II toxin-antitoxin system RelE/ParE family toxin [Campylobacter sp.]|nr:type II toxin-antitoxin system RelE/ParE family toxin [Campylobacter sp.]
MVIIYSKRFKDELKAVFDYIAKDSKIRAKNFLKDLYNKLKNLIDYPYIGRIADGLSSAT